MRYQHINRARRFTIKTICTLMMVSMPIMVPSVLADRSDDFSLKAARIVDSPHFSYEIMEVLFNEPQNLSTGAGFTRRFDLVKVIIRGQGFQPKSTGPIVWLNGIPTMRTEVSKGGKVVYAHFLERLQEIEVAAARMGRWELLYQPHESAPEVLRIFPAGASTEVGRVPLIHRLSSEERARLQSLKFQFGID